MLTCLIEVQNKSLKKRVRKRPKKRTDVNLLSLELSLQEIMQKEKELRSKKMEVSVKPTGREIQREIARFKAVMHHPEFKANPLKVIREHVSNTWESKQGMIL